MLGFVKEIKIYFHRTNGQILAATDQCIRRLRQERTRRHSPSRLRSSLPWSNCFPSSWNWCRRLKRGNCWSSDTTTRTTSGREWVSSLTEFSWWRSQFCQSSLPLLCCCRYRNSKRVAALFQWLCGKRQHNQCVCDNIMVVIQAPFSSLLRQQNGSNEVTSTPLWLYKTTAN